MVKTKGNCFILFTHFYVAFRLWSKPTNLLVSLWLQGMNGYWGNLAQEQRQRPLGHWSLAPCWIHLLLQHSWKCQHLDYMNITKISHHLSEFYTILQCHKGKLCAVFFLGLQHVQGLRIIQPLLCKFRIQLHPSLCWVSPQENDIFFFMLKNIWIS